jgi:nicotinamidase-related amidase
MVETTPSCPIVPCLPDNLLITVSKAAARHQNIAVRRVHTLDTMYSQFSIHQTTSPQTITTMAPLTPFDKTALGSPGHYGPQQTALLLLDYSQIIIDHVGAKAHSAVKVAATMRHWAQKHNIEVIHCLIGFDNMLPLPTYKEPTRLHNLVAHVQTSGGGDEPAELLGGRIADRTFYRRLGNLSAVHFADVKQYLKGNGIGSLVIMGLSTSGCVLRTSFEAAEEGFVVTVVSDGCADPEQEVHDFLFGRILQRTAFVMTAEEFREGYGEIL